MIERRPAATQSIDDTAAELGVSRDALYRAARRGDLPVIRIGRRILVPRAVVDRLLCREPR